MPKFEGPLFEGKFMSQRDKVRLIRGIAQAYVNKIRKAPGLIRSRKYEKNTVGRRKYHGLQSEFIDLTGNETYSDKPGHNIRMLNDLYYKARGNKAWALFTDQFSDFLWNIHSNEFTEVKISQRLLTKILKEMGIGK